MTVIVVISKDLDYQLDDKVSAIACQTVRHIVLDAFILILSAASVEYWHVQ